MRLGVFTTDFAFKPPFGPENLSVSWGGVGETVHNLVTNLKGHDVEIFTTSPGKEFRLKNGRVSVRAYKKAFKIENTDISLDLLWRPLKHQLDLVHIQMGSPPGCIAGYLYSKSRNRNYVVSYHGDSDERYGGYTRSVTIRYFNSHICHRILEDACIITAPSAQYASQSRFLKKHRNKIVIVPNGVNLEQFDCLPSKEECRNKVGLRADANVVLFVGRLWEQKAPHILVKAIESVMKVNPRCVLIFLGDGVMRGELENLCRNLGIVDRVLFVGFVSDEVLKNCYIKSADVFVLPSYEESFGIVLLEASACGVPLVTSDLESFKAIVDDGYNGFLTRVGDNRDLAEKISYLLENDKERMRMGAKALEKVRNYSWLDISKKFEQIYDLVSS